MTLSKRKSHSNYRCWSQFFVMVATIFATYKNGLRHLVATTFATTLVSFFGLRHGTLLLDQLDRKPATIQEFYEKKSRTKNNQIFNINNGSSVSCSSIRRDHKSKFGLSLVMFI